MSRLATEQDPQHQQPNPTADIVPLELVDAINRLEQGLVAGENNPRKIAAFDLDNTLLVGDIGEAVYAQLLAEGYVLPLSWSVYQFLLRTNKRHAYEQIVRALAGYSIETIVKATHKVLLSPEANISFAKGDVPVPHARPAMKILIQHLRNLGYDIYVLTSSNELSARIVTSQFFGIPEHHVFGVRMRIDQDILTGQILWPAPIGEGKVDVYHHSVGSSAPLITAGDTVLDLPLLRLTHPEGIALWLGEDEVELQHAREILNSRLYVLNASRTLQLDKQGAHL